MFDMLKTNVYTFCYKDNWFVEIVEMDDSIETWLYNDEYGIKSLMFSRSKNDVCCVCEAVVTAIENLNNESYLESYEQEFMD